MPLLYFTSTTTPTLGHEIEVRLKDEIYTCIFGTGSDLYVDQEKVASLTTALQSLDPGATVHTRPE